MNVNEIISVKIEKLAQGGEGIARHDGMTIFVENAVPGDEVKIKLTLLKSSYGKAHIVEMINPSQDRITPPCKYFEECGACQMQHINYKAQLKIKASTVKETIHKIGGIDTSVVLDVIGMDNPWGYRNKMQYPVRKTQIPMTRQPRQTEWQGGQAKSQHKEFALSIGYYKKGTHDVVDIEDCIVLHPFLNDMARAVRDVIKKSRVEIYNEDSGKGLLRHILGKIGFSTGEALLSFVINEREFQGAKKIIGQINEKLVEKKEKLVGITNNVNTRSTNVILGERNNSMWGRDFINETLGDLKFRLSASSFFQVNPVQTLKLYNTVKSFANLKGSEKVVDAFCGIGTISLWLAKNAKEIYGIEENPQAIENAKQNAQANNINNAFFRCGTVETILQQFADTAFKADVLILDPPRSGCSEKVISNILKMAPKKIVYVSCDPATFARDLKLLSSKYIVNKIQPVDMFPHTSHIECVGELLGK